MHRVYSFLFIMSTLYSQTLQASQLRIEANELKNTLTNYTILDTRKASSFKQSHIQEFRLLRNQKTVANWL